MSPRRPDSRNEALRILGLNGSADAATILAAYRRLVRHHHPDAGGDPEVFRALTSARDRLLAAPEYEEQSKQSKQPTQAAGSGRRLVVRQRSSRRMLHSIRRRLGRRNGNNRRLE
jgi:molecular chaperone DnaJ